MKQKTLFRALALGLAIIICACSTTPKEVKRIDTHTQVDLSGRWNDTDSKMAADELTTQVLGEQWLANFQRDNKRKPVVIVGLVHNKSHEHIEPETFIKDIERSFIQAGTVRLVQGGQKRTEIRAERADQQEFSSQSTMKKWGLEVGADYLMQGSINSTVDSNNKQRVVEYQINLELTDIQTNEIVWIGEKKIKKLITN